MELRSYNVEEVYLNWKKNHKLDTESVKDLFNQLEVVDETNKMVYRKDGEVWTNKLQIIDMLVEMGVQSGVCKVENNKIKFL